MCKPTSSRKHERKPLTVFPGETKHALTCRHFTAECEQGLALLLPGEELFPGRFLASWWRVLSDANQHQNEKVRPWQLHVIRAQSISPLALQDAVPGGKRSGRSCTALYSELPSLGHRSVSFKPGRPPQMRPSPCAGFSGMLAHCFFCFSSAGCSQDRRVRPRNQATKHLGITENSHSKNQAPRLRARGAPMPAARRCRAASSEAFISKGSCVGSFATRLVRSSTDCFRFRQPADRRRRRLAQPCRSPQAPDLRRARGRTSPPTRQPYGSPASKAQAFGTSKSNL